MCDSDVHSCGGGRFYDSPVLFCPPPPAALLSLLFFFSTTVLGLSSLPNFSPLFLHLSLFLLRHSLKTPPPHPLFWTFCSFISFHAILSLSLFSSFLYLGVALPVFFSVPSEVRLTAKWPSPEGGGGVVSELAIFLFSLSSVCVWVLAHVLSLLFTFKRFTSSISKEMT